MMDMNIFFEDENKHFFRPLTGKYREKTRACIQALYLRLNGPTADCSFHLSRDDLIEIFRYSLDRCPDLDGDEDESSISNDEALARSRLVALEKDGWIDKYHDDIDMKSAYRFTPKGRVFAKAFVDSGRDKLRTNNRNTRNTRSAIRQYAESQDPYDLIEADRFAQEVFNDFNENIEEIQLRQQLQAREVVNELKLEQISEDFFEYLEKRFMPSVSKNIGEDSVKKYQSEIKESIEKIKIFPDEMKAKMELSLRREFPVLKDLTERSVLYFLLNNIENRIDNACEVKLPELRKSLDSYTRRTHMIIRQLMRIHSSGYHDVSQVCRRLGQLPDEEGQEILEMVSQSMTLGQVALVNPENVKPSKTKKRELINTQVTERAKPTPQQLLDIKVRSALEAAFSFEDTEILEALIDRIKETGQIRTRHLPITAFDELYRAMHLSSLGNVKHEHALRIQ